jgi:hypothetical protein
MIYLIQKNLHKGHIVPPPITTIKEKKIKTQTCRKQKKVTIYSKKA